MEFGIKQHTVFDIQRGLVPLLVMLAISAISGQSVTANNTDDSTSRGPLCPGITQNFHNCAQSGPAPLPSTPRDCAEVKDAGYQKSGRYAVTPDDGEGSFFVFCDMETNGGGWTVVQRRENGFVDFYRSWSDYKHGFGLVVGEHWLGNDKIHRLTSQKRYILRVEMSDWIGGVVYAEYDLFIVLGEESLYQLVIGEYEGTAGDSLLEHNGHKFTTKDADHDTYEANCAVRYHGAWWYSGCHFSNLNGQYYGSDEISTNEPRGISWYHWKNNQYYTLKQVEMKIRPA